MRALALWTLSLAAGSWSCGGKQCADCEDPPAGAGACAHPYTVSECPSGEYCSPTFGGVCVNASCGPSSNSLCNDGITCALLSTQVGVCLPPCDYGFIGESYTDTCTDAP